MKINRSAIKHNAKLIISRTKPSPVLAALIFLAIAMVLNWLTMIINGEFYALQQSIPALSSQLEAAMSGGTLDYSALAPLYERGSLSPISSILILALGIMSLMIGVGMTIFCFNAAHLRPVSLGNLFDGFAIFGKVLWLKLLQWFFTYLWSLAGIVPGSFILAYAGLYGGMGAFFTALILLLPLMILPGLIAALRYRMSLYIMLDNPEMSALECINNSKYMMMGKKWELFVLDLSFIGWYLLLIVPFVSVWVTPYHAITEINYYAALRDLSSYQDEGSPANGGNLEC